MSAIRKFVSDTVIYGLTTILSRMLNFVMTPFFLGKFSAPVYGVFTNLYAYASLINAVLAFGMETTYFRYLQKVEGDKNRVFDSSFLITLLTTILFLFSLFSLTRPIAHWLSVDGNPQEYIAFVKLVALVLAADAIAVVPFAKLRAQGRPIRYGAIKMLNILTFVGVNFFLLAWLPEWQSQSEFWQGFASGWFQEGWLGNVFIANLVASLLTLVLLLPQVLTFRLRMDPRLLRDMLRYTFPILVANISFIINENLDKMMLPRLIPGEEGELDLGIYGAVSKMAVFLNLFVTAFRLGAEPFFFSYSKNENARRTYAQIMEYFVIAMVVVMLGLCANMDWLKGFIRGSEGEVEVFWTGLNVVPILLFNYVLLGIYMNLSVWYKLSDQTRYGLYISGIGAVSTIVLNLMLIPLFSYWGAAISTTIVYLIMVGLSYFWGQNNYSIPYNVKKIGCYLLIGMVASWLLFSVHFLVANAILLVMLAVVIYLEKEMLSKLLRRN
ncbi:MAG: MATE family efflux transporter [Sphingobacterium sp.]